MHTDATRLGRLVGATVASRDVAAAVAFAARAFDLETLDPAGGDALLGVPGDTGWLRLVPAAADPPLPAAPPWEIGGRGLGLSPRDLVASRAAAIAAGGSPTAMASYEIAPGEITDEYWVPGPDDVTWLLPRPRSAPGMTRSHGALVLAAVATDRLDAALALYAGAGGMTVLVDRVFDAPAFATLFGFAEGSAVRAAVLQCEDGGMVLELWAFPGLEMLHGPERPVGLRRITFDAADPAGAGARLQDAGARPVAPGVWTHDGIEIEVQAA